MIFKKAKLTIAFSLFSALASTHAFAQNESEIGYPACYFQVPGKKSTWEWGLAEKKNNRFETEYFKMKGKYHKGSKTGNKFFITETSEKDIIKSCTVAKEYNKTKGDFIGVFAAKSNTDSNHTIVSRDTPLFIHE